MNYSVNIPGAVGYTPQQTRAAFNTALAEAHASADPRYNMKPLDKAGMSRGGAQQFSAGIASAQNLADGVAKAYQTPMQDAVTNASIDQANAAAREGMGLDVFGIDQQANYARALESLTRQQAARNFQSQALGGLLGGGGSGWLDNFLGY